jgi:16S rRNA processing protein RimM
MLLAGQIGKPHGIAGEVYVTPISDDPGRFEPGASLVHEDGRELTVETSRAHRDRFLVKFAGFDARTEAEGLRGSLYVHIEQARELEADEFWPHDLVGAEVVEPGGRRVGRITEVRPGPAHDLLVVETGSGERMIPAVKAIVTSIDTVAHRIHVDPPAGLLD